MPHQESAPPIPCAALTFVCRGCYQFEFPPCGAIETWANPDLGLDRIPIRLKQSFGYLVPRSVVRYLGRPACASPGH